MNKADRKRLKGQRAVEKNAGRMMTGDEMRRKGIPGWQNCDPNEHYVIGVRLRDEAARDAHALKNAALAITSMLEERMNTKRSKIERILRKQAIRQDQIVARLLQVDTHSTDKRSSDTVYDEPSGTVEAALAERNERRAVLARERMQRQYDAQHKIIIREKELEAQRASRETKANSVSRKTSTSKEVGLREISIEQARQHEHDLKEREKRRVADLATKMQIIQIGKEIQKGA